MTAKDYFNEVIIQQEGIERADDPLYVMTIELDKGKSESIRIYAESKPEELSYDFCKKHNLDFASLVHLANQIKSLLENIPNGTTNQQGAENNDKDRLNKEECIIEVDEEDLQVSDRRMISNNNNSLSHSLQEEEMEDKGHRHEENGEVEEGNSQVRDVTKASRENTEKSLKDNNNQPQISEITTHSLFSYEEFYNRFKNKLELKQKTSSVANQSVNDNNKKKNASAIIESLRKGPITKRIISISENEKRLKDFLLQSKNLDEIFNMRHNVNEHPNCFKAVYSKSHTPSMNDPNSSRKPMIPFSKFTTKSASSQSLNREKRNFGERLYLTAIQLKERTSRKILALKQTIDQVKEADNTFQPTTFNKTQLFNKAGINKHNIPFCNRRPYAADRRSKIYKANASYSEKFIRKSNQGNDLALNGNEDKQFNTITHYNSNDRLYHEKKEETFSRIFHLLTHATFEPHCSMPSKVYDIIQPVISQIKAKSPQGEDIKERDFVRGCIKLFDAISFDNKRALLEFNMSQSKKSN